eukprot:TRINITY_DN3188_c0_g2_i1.p3 TRINITY_DN3188_c0_g2~~TRINITY_DN3188_c0_g2_i1.p3  ORF type:complete len:201 (-),score=-20.92 TRINITY_DN3188_c0_g2_i1:429-1031(-)
MRTIIEFLKLKQYLQQLSLKINKKSNITSYKIQIQGCKQYSQKQHKIRQNPMNPPQQFLTLNQINIGKVFIVILTTSLPYTMFVCTLFLQKQAVKKSIYKCSYINQIHKHNVLYINTQIKYLHHTIMLFIYICTLECMPRSCELYSLQKHTTYRYITHMEKRAACQKRCIACKRRHILKDIFLQATCKCKKVQLLYSISQ